MAEQSSWRYCQNCHTMFYDGYADKGTCAAGGHVAQGLTFLLPYDGAATAPSQDKWRYCDKCHVMFYGGFGNGGQCYKGGGHNAQGFNFFLPHNNSASDSAQDKWRYCDKCRSLFYEGYPGNGKCPAGGGHNPQGFNFVLPFQNGNGAAEGDIKWMGVPINVLGAVALKEFGEGLRSQIPDDWYLQIEAKYQSDPLSFKIGYTYGLLFGLYTGLKDLFGLLVDLAKISAALNPISVTIFVAKEAFFLLTEPSRSTIKKQYENVRRVALAVKDLADDINKNPNDYIVLGREVGEALGKIASHWFTHDFMKRSPQQVGETFGELVGQMDQSLI